ncbi:MAG: hypothetical protein M3357_16345, partial [Actinomycetota bacterium]|nr:hypothetical protein [Actinomycetota bacterium]
MAASKHPVTFVAFDLLSLDGHLVTARPWRSRRALLVRLGATGRAGPSPAPTSATGGSCSRRPGVLAHGAEAGSGSCIRSRLFGYSPPEKG